MSAQRFFTCLIGKNSEGTPRYGVLILCRDTNPPVFRLATRNQDLGAAANLAKDANAGIAKHITELSGDDSDRLFGKEGGEL